MAIGKSFFTAIFNGMKHYQTYKFQLSQISFSYACVLQANLWIVDFGNVSMKNEDETKGLLHLIKISYADG